MCLCKKRIPQYRGKLFWFFFSPLFHCLVRHIFLAKKGKWTDFPQERILIFLRSAESSCGTNKSKSVIGLINFSSLSIAWLSLFGVSFFYQLMILSGLGISSYMFNSTWSAILPFWFIRNFNYLVGSRYKA